MKIFSSVIDFANNLLIIRAGKGERDRTTILPDKVKESLKAHLQRMKKLHDQDLAKGYRGTTLPDALEKKYPNSFATHLPEAGHNIRTIQELMGHKNVNTTTIYTHVARKSYSDTSSPLDKM